METITLPEPIIIRELSGSLFRLPLPDGWTDRSVYCAGGPTLRGFKCSIAVTAESRPALDDLPAYVRVQLRQLEGQLTDFAPAPGAEQPVPEGAAQRIDYTWTTPEKVPVRQVQWYLYRRPHVWVITATAHKEAFAEIESLLKQVVGQFSLK